MIMQFNVITIFPEIISSYCGVTILGRAQADGIIGVRAVNLRDYTNNRHRSVDDSPYGGGPGMVMKPEPIYRALNDIDALPMRALPALGKIKRVFSGRARKRRTILLSPRGRQFDQRLAERWSKLDEITFIAGRFEGVDQRVADFMADEEISIGPYILAGGELGALVIIEAVSRLLPGVLGNPESLLEETHTLLPGNSTNNLPTTNYQLPTHEYPQYTKPADFMGWPVPEILLSGNHAKIKEWRDKQTLEKSVNP